MLPRNLGDLGEPFESDKDLQKLETDFVHYQSREARGLAVCERPTLFGYSRPFGSSAQDDNPGSEIVQFLKSRPLLSRFYEAALGHFSHD
jgi:hypothetical protein